MKVIKKENKLVPALRFEEFKGEWEVKKLGKITSKIGSGSTPSGGEQVYTTHGILFIRSQNVKDDQLSLDKVSFISSEINEKMKGSIVQPNDVLLNITGASIGRSCVVPSSFNIGNVNQHVCIIRVTDEYTPRFLQPFLSSHKGQKLIYQNQTGSGREGLNFVSIRSFKIVIPSLPEQQKIATFLSAVDQKIEQLRQKVKLLEQYKKGLLQQIFSQEIRFKDENGEGFADWEVKRLSGYLFEHKTRNKNTEYKEVFSVAKTKGVINQIEHLGRSYASKDISNYKVVLRNDVIYTKSPTSNFPYGIIKQNKLDRIGVVSVLYAVFSPQNKYIGYLLHAYFLSSVNTYNYLNPLVHKGAKNTMNINNNDFLNGMKLSLPKSIEEQQKIATFLSSMDQKITQVQEQLTQTQAFKQGLLQQLFV